MAIMWRHAKWSMHDNDKDSDENDDDDDDDDDDDNDIVVIQKIVDGHNYCLFSLSHRKHNRRM